MLLEHATWLRRLAAGIVGDSARADDVVQDTWVAALSRPPSLDRPVRPWLVRVLRNAARFRWRSDVNRSSREEAVAALGEQATPTSEELLARHELQQLLARLVGELDEPFRGTILLCYAEGLAPTQIARRLGIPASTVRWRLREGLEQLRRGLDLAHEGDRKAWLLALAPIALWPRTSHAAPGSALAIGTAVAAVVLIVVATRSSNDAHPTLVSARAALPARPAHDIAPVITAGWRAQEGAASRHVAGHVVQNGAPVANALVRLTSEATPASELRTDALGHFDFGPQEARAITLGAASPETLGAIDHLDLRDPTLNTDDLELALQACAAGLEGRVIDAIGTPIARVQLLREDALGTETDASGRYSLCVPPTAALTAQIGLMIHADGYGAIAINVAPAGRIHRDFTLIPEATISGTAVPGAEIWLEPERDDYFRSDERPARLAAATDADGRFAIAGVSAGTYRLGAAARGMTAVGALVTVNAGDTTDVTVRMVAAAVVHGVVTARGTAVAGAHVAVRPAGTWGVVIGHDDPSDEPIVAGDAVTQADGTFVLDGVPPGPTAFTALPMRVVSSPFALVAGDNRITIDTQPLGKIRGFVRRHGAVVPYARVGIAHRGVNADSTGHYEIAGLEPGKYDYYADDSRRGSYIAGHLPSPLGEGEIRDFDVELAWGARVTGTVVDATGQLVAGAQVRIASDTGELARCITDANGAFVCASLEGGHYRPAVYPSDAESRAFPFVVPASAIDLPGDGAITDLRLVIDTRTTAIDGTVVDEIGAPMPDVRVRALSDGIEQSAFLPALSTATDGSGHFHIGGLAPGDYALDAQTLDGSRKARVTVEAGTSRATLVLAQPSCTTGAPFDPRFKPVSPVVWDDRIELVGWDLPATARVGEPVEVALVFRVRKPLIHAWQLFAHFDGSPGHRNNADHEPLAGRCPISTWQPGDVLVDRFTTTFAFSEAFALRIGFFATRISDVPWRDLALSTAPDAMRAENDAAELSTITVQ